MLRKYSVTSKLLLLVAVLSAVIVGIGIYGISKLKVISQHSQSLYADRIYPIAQLTNIRFAYSDNVLDAVANVQNHSATFNQAALQIEQAQKTIDTNWAAYKLTYLTPEETKLAAGMETLMAATKVSMEDMEQALASKDVHHVDAMVKSLNETVDAAILKANQLVQLQLKVSGELNQSNLQIYKSTLQKFSILIALSLLAGFIVAFFIVVDVRRLFTELEDSNRKIKASEEKCRAFIKYAGDAILMMDRQLCITDVNNSACALLGYTRTELTGMKVSDILPKQELESHHSRIEMLKNAGNSMHERRFRRKDGSEADTEVNVRLLEDEGYIAIIRDIGERKTAEKALREREAQLTALLENMEGATSLLDSDKRYVIFNRRFIQDNLTLTNRDPCVGQEVYDGFPDEIRNERLKMLDNVLKGNKEVLEIDHLRDGKRVYYRSSFSPVITDGKVTGISTFSLDLTKSKETEIKIRESEKKYRNIFENVMDVFFQTTLDGTILDVSPSAETLVGLTRQQLIGTRVESLYYAQVDREKGESLPRVLSKNGETKDFELRFKSATNEPIYISVNARLIRGAGGRATHIDGMFRNITESKKADEKLRQSEEKHRALTENISDAIMLLNEDARIIYQSPAVERISGYRFGEDGHMQVFQFVHPDDVEVSTDCFKQASVTPGIPVPGQFRMKHKQGHYIWIEGTTVNLLHNEGVKALIVYFRDITDRINAARAISESEQNYRSLFEQASDVIIITDLEANIIDVNTSGSQMFGYSRPEMLEKNVSDLIEPEQLKRDPLAIDAIMNGKHNIRRRLARRSNGEVFELESNAKRILDDRILIIARDITELRQVEKQIEQSEEKYRVLTENISDAIMLINENYENIYQSPTVERLVGFRFEDRKDKKIFDFAHPEDRQTAVSFFQSAFNSPGVPIQSQFRVQHKLGHFIWIEGTVMNLLHNESIKAFVVNYRDITGRKIAEQEIADLNESLEQKVIDRTARLQEAIKALETFSYSVSHDLRAPARAINGFIKIIQEEHAATFSPDLKELFEYIAGSGKRMTAIIEDLLTLAKYDRTMPKLREVDMDMLVKNVWNNISVTNAHNAILKMEPLPPALVDASLIEQVLVNLLSNAIKYSSKKNQPIVTVGYQLGDNTVTYSVKDNGAGFDMKNYNRLFGAFQRLHGASEFEGTGVGLLLVKRIIEKHGGVVRAEGVVKEGATFYFTLPLITDK